jgi:phage FluMu gp28-like protein
MSKFDPDEVFLPYQREYLSVVEHQDVTIIEKSRRVGISWTDAADSCLTAAAKASAGGMDCLYIGYNKDMASEYIEAVADWTKKFQSLIVGAIEEDLITDEDKQITVFRVRYNSGFKVEALSSRPSNLRGKQGKVTIDEAAFHEDLPGLIKAAMAMLIWGGRVVIISTHNGDCNYFNELIADARAGKNGHKVLRYAFQDAVAQGLYRRICQVNVMTWTVEAETKWVESIYRQYGPTAAEELDVIPTGGTDVYLSRTMVERAMMPGIPVLCWKMPADLVLRSQGEREYAVLDWCQDHLLPLAKAMNPNLRTFVGEDFARSGDLTSIWIAQEQPNLQLKTAGVIELRSAPFDCQRQLLWYLLDRLPRFSGASMDARGNGQHLAEITMQRYGSGRIECVMLTPQWYQLNMPKLRARFEDGEFIIPKNADILSDFRMIRNVNGTPKVPDDLHAKGTDGYDRHGDSAIAGAMVCHAAKSENVIYEYEPVRSVPKYLAQDEDDGPRNPAWRSVGF